MSSSMSIIGAEKASEAYFNAARKARLLRERADAERTIAEALDGAYITKSLDAKLRELLPTAQYVCVSKSSYGADKYVHVHPGNVHSYDECWDICLGNNDNNRVNGEKIKQAATSSENEAAEIEKALEHFSEIIGTYNALATAYAGIYDDLHVFFEELVYADYNARRNK